MRRLRQSLLIRFWWFPLTHPGRIALACLQQYVSRKKLIIVPSQLPCNLGSCPTPTFCHGHTPCVLNANKTVQHEQCPEFKFIYMNITLVQSTMHEYSQSFMQNCVSTEWLLFNNNIQVHEQTKYVTIKKKWDVGHCLNLDEAKPQLFLHLKFNQVCVVDRKCGTGGESQGEKRMLLLYNVEKTSVDPEKAISLSFVCKKAWGSIVPSQLPHLGLQLLCT